MDNQSWRRAPAVLALGLLAIAPVHAAQRTFVATTGDNAHTAQNCSLVFPCRAFSAAMTVTDTNGEIVVLDSGGYGTVVVDKSVSIIASPGVYAGISVFSAGTGILIDTPGARVALRGLTINGQGGDTGINFAQGAQLHVENCVIAGLGTGIWATAGVTSVKDTIIRGNSQVGMLTGQGAASVQLDSVRIQANDGFGLRVTQGAGGQRVAVRNSTIADNGAAGILINAAPNSLASVDIESTEVTSNNWIGGAGAIAIVVDTNGKAEVTIARSLIARNHGDAVYGQPISGTSVIHASVTDTTITGNYGQGLNVLGSSVTFIASGNTITRNQNFALHNSGGTFYTRSNNSIQGNFDGTTSGAITPLTPL